MFLLAALLLLPSVGFAAASLIYPEPQQISVPGGRFDLDEKVSVVIPQAASDRDLSLARFLVAELSDRYGLALQTERVTAVPASGHVILMGSVENPLIREYCTQQNLTVSRESPGPDGYVLHVGERVVLVAGSDDQGAFYGVQSLRQLVERGQGRSIQAVQVRDWPHKSFRGIKLYLPGRENFAFFKRFLRDFMALYKYNKLIVELNAAMRLDRHPELNTGWAEMARDLIYSRRDRSTGPNGEYQDSTHHDTGDGGILEKAEVADLVRWATEYNIEVIPELPSLTHSYYLLTSHRELAEIPDAEWPDTYCPSNPKSYELLFDVFDEYIDVMKPKLIHVGHDEWRMPWGVCPKCKGKGHRELYAQDVIKIHSYLAKKGVRTAMWGDHLLEAVAGPMLVDRKTRAGYKYRIPGGLTPDQVQKLIPKDILVFNWFWNDSERGSGEANEETLGNWGFEQVYGNFTPEIRNYGRRSGRSGILGGAPSAWIATTEFNFGKDLIYEFTGCASLLWSKQWPETWQLSRIVQSMMPQIRRNLSGRATPSEDGEAVRMLPVLSLQASSAKAAAAVDAAQVKSGRVTSGRATFELPGKSVVAQAGEGGIPVGEDASSLIFLHALAKPASNEPGHRYIYNFPDTADLLGWYEVVYDDGFVETVPVRYGENILEWSWGRRNQSSTYCYRADPVNIGKAEGNPVTFFAFEWTNPRFGKIIREVRLKGTTGFRNTRGRVIPENSIVLAAISATKKKGHPEPVKARTYVRQGSQ